MSGLSDPGAYEVLEELASQIPASQAIVELGTYEGAGAIALARGATRGNGAHVWSIDPHDLPGQRTTTGTGVVHGDPIDYTDPIHRERAEAAVSRARLGKHITLIQDFSEHAAQVWQGPPVALWYHDGDHREGAVRRDYAAWERHLLIGACVVFDDYHEWFPGVIAVVHALADKGVLSDPLVVGSTAICNVL